MAGRERGRAGVDSLKRKLFLSPLARERELAIRHQITRRYATRNEEIVAGLREAAGAGPPVDPAVKVKRLVAEIAIQMALLHGGDWKVEIQPEKGFLLVSRRGRRCR
jgi:hypothetical protein